MRWLTLPTLAQLALVSSQLSFAPSRNAPSQNGPRRLQERANTTITIPSPPSSIPSSPPSPVPIPMDLYVSYSVSTPCLSYITTKLSFPTFKSCLPFSLLLTTSTSFAQLVQSSLSSGNLSTLNELLAYLSSPQPSSDECAAYAQESLKELQQDAQCGKDLKEGKPLAQALVTGLGNYDIMREAAGLTDEEGGYCYLDVITAAKPDDLYMWSLPGGSRLPASSTPSCSSCSSQLLNLYAHAPLASLDTTIVQSAIDRVNSVCGAGIPAMAVSATKSGSAGQSVGLSVMGIQLVQALVATLLAVGLSGILEIPS